MRRQRNTGFLVCLSFILFVISGSSQQAIDDHGNEPTPFLATLITVDNFQLEGRIEFVGDTDCFMFEGVADARYTFEIDQPTDDLDPLLVLFATNGLTVLALDDDGEDNVAAKIEWQPLLTGFYFVCVRSATPSEGLGSYRLIVKNDAALNSSVTTLPDPLESDNDGTNDAQNETSTTPSTDEEQSATEPTAVDSENASTTDETETSAGEPTPTTPPGDNRESEPMLEERPRIGVLSADDTSSLNDVQSYLLTTDNFLSVDLIDVSKSTPTAEQLNQFDGVLVWADSQFADAQELGNQLADYVDHGGGVVVAAVSFDAPNPFDPDALGGRFLVDGYYVIQPVADNVDTGRRRLGAVHISDHPIMEDVDDIDGGPRSFHSPTAALTAGATAVASWDNGDILVAVKSVGQTRRVDINLFPPSGRVDTDLWPFRPSNKVPQLFANALLWVTGRI